MEDWKDGINVVDVRTGCESLLGVLRALMIRGGMPGGVWGSEIGHRELCDVRY